MRNLYEKSLELVGFESFEVGGLRVENGRERAGPLRSEASLNFGSGHIVNHIMALIIYTRLGSLSTTRKRDPGLRLTRFDSVDGNLYEVTQLDVTTRGPARTRQCDGMATTSRGTFLTLTSTTIGGGGMDNTSLQK